MPKRSVLRGVLLGLVVCLTSLCYNDHLAAQDKKDDSSCLTPYIKIIKPKLAQPGQVITIRGRRFGPEVVVKTECATSNSDFLKIGSETEESKSKDENEWN